METGPTQFRREYKFIKWGKGIEQIKKEFPGQTVFVKILSRSGLDRKPNCYEIMFASADTEKIEKFRARLENLPFEVEEVQT